MSEHCQIMGFLLNTYSVQNLTNPTVTLTFCNETEHPRVYRDTTPTMKYCGLKVCCRSVFLHFIVHINHLGIFVEM